METPTISAKMQRKSLSSKKAPVKSIRGVLQTPREKIQTKLTTDQDLEIQSLIKKLFEIPKPPPKIKFKEIKHLNKEERKLLRPKQNLIKSTHNCFVIGINNFFRKLEADHIEAVIMSSNLLEEIPIISDNILRFCVLKNVPFISMNDLSNQLRLTLGIPSLIIGFKKNQKCEYFKEIVCKIKEFSTLKPKIQPNSIDVREEEKIETPQVKEYKNLYLYRPENLVGRVFKPSGGEPKLEMEVDMNFIAFSKDDSPHSGFIPMSVKRIKPNPNRINKKIKKS